MPRPTSSARAFFDHIRSQADPVAFLTSIPDPNTPPDPFFEEEWLDFKGRPRDDNDTKRIWSKALSGYANITDALIIWGIDARKTQPRDIDAASGLRLIPDPSAFESKLRDWIRDATNPPVMGVEYQSHAGPTGEGFVVCLVPESHHKPHRAEFAEKHYYYRAGDDFLLAEPGLLRTLFFPQGSCHVDIKVFLTYEVTPQQSGFERPTIGAHLEIQLLIDGSRTGRDGYITMSHKPQLNLRIFKGIDWVFKGYCKGKAGFEAMRPLHPGEEVALLHPTEVELVDPLVEQPLSFGGTTYVMNLPKIEFSFEVYFADQQVQVLNFVLDARLTKLGEPKGVIEARAINRDL
jgi:hypothetical protein